MKITICLILAVAVVAAHAAGYRQSMQNRVASSSGYGNQGGYGSGKDGSDDQSGNVDYRVKYRINLPEDSHGSSADWQVEQDPKTARYTLKQTHPYGAKSNVYFSTENDH
ncbi:Uncharacterised protein r2_g478 [Pycnogonum litorale]